jgi:hypothetical protein
MSSAFDLLRRRLFMTSCPKSVLGNGFLLDICLFLSLSDTLLYCILSASPENSYVTSEMANSRNDERFWYDEVTSLINESI